MHARMHDPPSAKYLGLGAQIVAPVTIAPTLVSSKHFDVQSGTRHRENELRDVHQNFATI